MNSYKITDLGLGPNGGFPIVTAINDKGIAVGRLGASAIRYDGSLQRLPGPSGFSQGDVATGINDGTPEIISGHVGGLTGLSRAAVWIDEEYHDLHEQLKKKQVNLTRSWVCDVNDKGIVVGRAQNKAFRLNIVIDEVEFLSITDPFIIGTINTHGNVVGWTSLPGEPFGAAFLYDSTTNLLPTPSAGGIVITDKFDINDSDVVVSNYQIGPEGRSHAFLYDHETKTSIDIHPPDFEASYACRINNQNQVVGWATNDYGLCATLWTLEDGTQRLNDLLTDPITEWDLLEAYDINDKGQIVGYGTYSGQPRGFLLTPVETPATSIDLSLGELKMEAKIIWLPGGIGVRVGGGFIYPKGPPVDPDGRRELEPFQRDALTGLAIQALARNISDPEARLLAENSGNEVVRMAAGHGLSGRSAKPNRSGCLSLFLRRILMLLER